MANERRPTGWRARHCIASEPAGDLTVETNLGHTFQKLGISSRNDLPPAISA